MRMLHLLTFQFGLGDREHLQIVGQARDMRPELVEIAIRTGLIHSLREEGGDDGVLGNLDREISSIEFRAFEGARHALELSGHSIDPLDPEQSLLSFRGVERLRVTGHLSSPLW
ncbi:hypothetical protein CCP3SC15_730020 [Gammaproteobacteria bacterium]